METVVRNNIMEHLVNEKLLADAQHGFVSGRSCVTANRNNRGMDTNA